MESPESNRHLELHVLRWRLISGTVLVTLLVALCWLDARAVRPGIYLAPVVALLCVLATGELLQMFRARGGDPLAGTMYVGTLLPVAASWVPVFWPDGPVSRLGWLACGLAAGLFVLVLGEMRRYGRAEESRGKPTGNLALAALSVLYLGGLVGFFVQLRLLPDSGGLSFGLAPLVSLVLVVKVSDTGQFFVGKQFGQRKLAPILSPNKTWEGAVGGIGASALVTATILTLYLESMTGWTGWGRVLLYCFLLSVAGLLGDLAESLLKRDAGVKDSSSWLPGLGGVLDVLDSLLLAAPVAYACWALGLVGR